MDENQIISNQNRFEELIKSINREGFNCDRLLKYLRGSDFYIAPASTKYHGSYRGGLVQHCLNVYDSIVKLSQMFYPDIDNNSLIIAALLHDLSKTNIYEESFSNKKIYSDNGKKFDERGKFDWVSVPCYVVKDVENRFVYGNHEQTAEFMASQFIPLTVDERVAILHHMGGKSWDSSQVNLSEIYNKYPLAVLLHMADMFSTYCIEGSK